MNSTLKCFQISIYLHWRKTRLDEQTILQYSKDITLNYLKKIKAEVNEQDGIYYVTLPLKESQFFGGETKRITFSPDVAATHSYELVVPGSNFLAVVLRETQKMAPVISGSIPKNDSFEESISKIDAQNCDVHLDETLGSEKLGVRFYFHVNLKSIKNSSSLRWTDVDLESLETMELPFNLEFNEQPLKLEKNDKRIDDAYSKAIEKFETEIKPQIEKYVGLTEQNKKGELSLLEAQEQKRLQEIQYDINNERTKLKEFDRKILRAKKLETRSKYVEQKNKFQKKLAKTEEQAVKQIQRIANDKKISQASIEQKYKPSLEFSLLAAQIFSYHVDDCLLTISKQENKKQVRGQYFHPSSAFVTTCERCRGENDSIHLCENSHVTCVNCIKNCLNCKKEFCLNCESELNPCYICKDGLCSECSKHCEFCSDVTCYSHAMACPHCSKFSCYFCSEKCHFCSRQLCKDGVKPCSSCNELMCSQDSKNCGICSKSFCVNHHEVCGICTKFHCDTDTATCKNCQRKYSSDCISKGKCTTCSNLQSTDREHPQVKLFIEKYPQYQKHKKWEFGGNEKYLIFKAKKLFGSKLSLLQKTL